MSIEERLAAELAQNNYHPRSSKHSDFQSKLIIWELLDRCETLRSRAASGRIVANLRHHQMVGSDDWVIDIAIGTCAGAPLPPLPGVPITIAAPTLIQIAIELKAIFTEHGKARRNRLRDFNAFHSYAHRYDPRCVAGAFLVVNASEWFYSPLRQAQDITKHGGPKVSLRSLIAKTVNLFRTIPLRNSLADGAGLEALGLVVIEHDNFGAHENPAAYGAIRRPTRHLVSSPGLPIGDPMHVETMLQRLCVQYDDRFPR